MLLFIERVMGGVLHSLELARTRPGWLGTAP